MKKKTRPLNQVVADGFDAIRGELRGVRSELKAVNALLRGIDARLEHVEVGHTEVLREHQRRIDSNEKEIGGLRLLKGGKNGSRGKSH